MCSHKSKNLFIKCACFFLIVETLIFLLEFFLMFPDYPIDMRIISTIICSFPISFISTIVAFFILEQRYEQNIKMSVDL